MTLTTLHEDDFNSSGDSVFAIIASAGGDEVVCAKCGGRVLEGRVTRKSPVERETKRRNRVPPELRLACALRVHNDLIISADYWGSAS